MQNLDKKASILIWAIMLSLIVAISFISISTKINKTIKLSWNIWEFNSEKIKIDSALFSRKNRQINNNKVIVFEDSLQRIFTLKQHEKINISFSGSSPFNIDMWVISWWSIFYKYIHNNISTASWMLNYSHSFSWKLDNTNKTWSLLLENLWWYSKILIKSENSFVTQQKKYKIIQTIGNNKFVQTRWITK